jgi:Homeodomain
MSYSIAGTPTLLCSSSDKSEKKPKLSKAEVSILEAKFQEIQKPTSRTKRELAEQFHVDVARINVSV